METAPAIGIDLGTDYSRVAVFRNGQVEVIPNEQGNPLTPSYVAFTDTGILIGEAAKDQLALNPMTTIFGDKCLIGRQLEDECVALDRKYWPFEVIKDEEGVSRIQVECKGQMKEFRPEEITAMLLTKMKEIAEVYLGRAVTDAVITVPACFNYLQRHLIKEAGIVSGLNVLRIINEPTAAAVFLAFESLKKQKEVQAIGLENHVLILDIGASNVGVTIFSVEDGIVEVKSTAGATGLGGNNFDDVMVTHFVKELQRKYNRDVTTDKLALHRLRTACEKAKRTLSTATDAYVVVENLIDGVNFCSTITRNRFEDLADNLFNSLLEIIKKTLRDATPPKIDKSQVDHIVLVGGSIRIPRVRNVLQDFFNDKELDVSLIPDTAVCSGAAIQAATVSGDKTEILQDLLLLDVTSGTLGIETAGGVMTTLVKRNTTIPTKQTQTFGGDGDDPQLPDGNRIRVYEGEYGLVKNNLLRGEFQLTGNDSSSPTEVTFDIFADSTLINVTAVNKKTGDSHSMGIQEQTHRRRQNQLKEMIVAAEEMKSEDFRDRNRVSVRNRLESYCIQMKRRMKSDKAKEMIPEAHREYVLDQCRDVIQWLDRNDKAEVELLERKQSELESFCIPIIAMINDVKMEVI